ncbi:LysR family transcriptional regulator [Agrobacterium rhizogenes]|nr:LysR family transcriptional regulator [Agrobacterium sp. ICMP 7243]KEA06771.1 LysR family transcriptional regulator [Rhizobium rhizogenes]OCJ06073.1 LysR family transcriptional regulator [Agrobacterium sp. 13-626]OCJ31181.1 LysR family transcriptional regulator [Agrobacterium sp. B133/95]MQB29675.1 LysR family transcriptional regulator [Rhizobium rhizogenes]
MKGSCISIYNGCMTRNFDISLIRTFAAVADHGSMTIAANTLHMTQGAVSQQIKRLEDALGCALFEREKRGLRLTNAGERLLGNARRLLILNDDIWADMTDSAIEGSVRLGVPYDLIGTTLAPVLKSYAERHPQVEISLICASSPELMRALDDGEIDLGIVEEPLGASKGECLAIDRLVWVGAKAGNAYRKDPLPISMVADTCAFRPSVFAALADDGRRWRTVFENGNIEATTATVRTDLAVTAWLASTVPADLDILGTNDGLPELPVFSVNLHLPKSEATLPATELARHIREGLMRPRQVTAA